MKIAIRGHESRGKEVIQILESLGGRNTFNYNGDYIRTAYFIGMDYSIYGFCTDSPKVGFKVYTLEEFETQFPFKIGDEVIFPVKTGWASGKITGLTYVGDQLKYEVDNRIAGYRYVESRILQLYPMKEERNITLTLEKAKEWYNKGGELKEIALQAFTEKELNPLPKSWEDYCMKYGSICLSARYTKISTKYDSLIKLEQLRDCWRQGWKPREHEPVYTIKFSVHGLCVYQFNSREFLSFPTKEMAEEFLEYFRDLIEKAGDLI